MNLFIIKGLIGLILSFGIASGKSWRQDGQSLNFVGEGTNDLSISILQSECENKTNLVFSPLGYSAILAILAEGSRGNTRNQLVTALKLPEDLFAVRNTFKDVLTSMQDHGVVNKPEFKNWFYVYKNYSVLDNYKNVLSENYLTNIKMIENDYYNQEQTVEQTTEEMEVKEVKKEKLHFETQEPIENYEHHEAEDSAQNEKLNEVKNEETPMEEIIARAIKNEIQIEKEMMTALSANRLSTVQETDGEEKSTSRMIIFNALYFRGNWSIPFAPKEKLYPFHKSENEEKLVKFISSEGEFEYGQISELEASALEIPYQEGRYSLLILVPNARDGIANLTSSLSGYSFRDIGKNLSKKTVSVCIPAFKFYSITKPKKALTKSGITDIFSEAADLSGISGTKGLYLDDLVQLVTLEVNENTGTYNYLTSSSLESTRDAGPLVEKFRADRPFLFFLRDRVKNLIVVAGKVHDPVRPNENE